MSDARELDFFAAKKAANVGGAFMFSGAVAQTIREHLNAQYANVAAQRDAAVALLRKMVSHYTSKPHCGHDFTCTCKDADIREARAFLETLK